MFTVNFPHVNEAKTNLEHLKKMFETNNGAVKSSIVDNLRNIYRLSGINLG